MDVYIECCSITLVVDGGSMICKNSTANMRITRASLQEVSVSLGGKQSGAKLRISDANIEYIRADIYQTLWEQASTKKSKQALHTIKWLSMVAWRKTIVIMSIIYI